MTNGNGASADAEGIPAGVDPRHWAVWQVRRTAKLGPDAKPRVIYNYIWQEEIQNGGFFLRTIPDRRLYVFSGTAHRAFEISLKSDEFNGYLFGKYGLLTSEDITRHVVTALRAYATLRGRELEGRRYTHYDALDNVLYVSRYDGRLWRIDGNGIDSAANGEGTLFLDDDGGRACEPDIGPHGVLLPTLIDGLEYVERTDGGLSKDQQRLALTTWLFAIAFPDLMPSKPMLLVEGTKGSGKTIAVQLIARAVHGKPHTHIVGKQDEKDFGVQLLRKPICLLDNTDSFVDWLQDALCSYATSGEWTRRKLYTDDGDHVVRPHSFIAIASKNPITFKRDDVADRCLIIRLDRRTTNTPAAALVARVEATREQLLGEWLYYLNEIVYAIRQGALARGGQAAASHRMADFAHLAHVIGAVLGHTEDAIDAMLDGVQAEREVLSQEGDPLLNLLDKWLDHTPNVGRSIRAADLHTELTHIGKMTGAAFYKNANTLAQKLRNPQLSKHFDIRQVGAKDGFKLYEIRRTEG